ncbi:A/G-specific adenine glycosylase [Desulforhopalus sp. IMCC35007]|uniref:A/G-specific adenine glycosylase n=1 Tax=Desulforhopalus sp. IMCC35007 TaxID=2569543 RepID=UPI00145D4D4B|nr:A/G-specific adenine glycosylase [Desulforhopalus sp. IMCC35007]
MHNGKPESCFHLSFSEQDLFVTRLLHWFRTTKRALPWRQTYDPYHVWISEIMLQQTQMERGIVYFNRWLERFPVVVDVALAAEDEILRYWEGLGYYARARNLHKAAKVIVEDYNCKVPSEYATLLELPGIGPYTAAAIASIAGNEDVVVVDANVNRVFARVFNIDQPVKTTEVQKKIRAVATALLPPGKARIFNQALMDFGGLLCSPKAPLCHICPVREFCRSYALGLVSVRPVLQKAQENIQIKRVAGIILQNGRIFMQQRKRSAVWGGLWEFPGGEIVVEDDENSQLDVALEIKKDTGLAVIAEQFAVEVKHQYTHHKIVLHCYFCRLQEHKADTPQLRSAEKYSWLSPGEADRLACPSGVRKVMEYLKQHRPELFSG